MINLSKHLQKLKILFWLVKTLFWMNSNYLLSSLEYRAPKIRLLKLWAVGWDCQLSQGQQLFSDRSDVTLSFVFLNFYSSVTSLISLTEWLIWSSNSSRTLVWSLVQNFFLPTVAFWSTGKITPEGLGAQNTSLQISNPPTAKSTCLGWCLW